MQGNDYSVIMMAEASEIISEGFFDCKGYDSAFDLDVLNI
ncbi:hypothetical protein PAECIP111893_00646 [Paenibacillus plantiphilus]|uniref:Uncharacterized protein n=1 Tax=Paenibacillus plantiphilus TaxID=2905650 RepID=A0ABN8G7D3_9BACL|nr:hypothetical protein PAECIP111893_00646 [Paenibacillus plantiphilus]